MRPGTAGVSPAGGRIRESAGETPAAPGTRYRSLDAWRGVACLMIVAYHASYYGAAASAASGVARPFYAVAGVLWTGVPLFFVISGYCIAASCDASGKGSIGRYFARRFRRIFPPYWIALGILLAAVLAASAAGVPQLFLDGNHGVPDPATLAPSAWLGGVTLTEKWLFHAFDRAPVLLLGPAWSLCYEEQFYAVCGAILLVAPRRFFLAAAGVSVATAGVMCVSALRPLPVDGFFFDGRWLLFAAGVLVYFCCVHATRAGAAAGCSVLAGACAAGVLQRFRSVQDFWVELAVAAAFGLVLVALWRRDAWLDSRRVLRPLSACGRMCYSLYLVHWPITKAITHGLDMAGWGGPWATIWVGIPMSLVASIAAARLFSATVERRFLNAPSRRTRTEPGAIATV